MCGALNNVICDSLKPGVLLNCSVAPTMFSLENFKNGGELAVQNLQEYFETSNLFSLAKDKLQSYQMMFIKQITLVNQAAVLAGVSATFANTINDYFIERMLAATDRDGINLVHREMLEYYLDQIVKSRGSQGYSAEISKATQYIDRRLHQKVSVKEVSDSVGLSPNYFANTFKNEVGISLTDYINRRKILVSQNMLQYSNFSITEISQYLAFSSQSYFIKAFKSVKGITPKQVKKT
ncbi:helix-turn-helix transcriptional regulator [Weissella cibaria]|uniref:Helix-turn-helix transcriptional regulator n=3 Tax=Weissella cibaria TaxID=137591 RepID=A0A9Q8JHZ8_9LACO|nr:helix-turn-helix transcriptional regulator [Weissella cibaria]TVV40782.1 helix-turn-helix transcriptional regulator [Weissella cibaria]